MADEIERGDIYFLYLPRVNRRTVRGVADVHRLCVVLHPYDEACYRLLVVAQGHRQLPQPGERRVLIVDRQADSPEELVREFRDEAFRDEVTGDGHYLAPARPAGEGVYALIYDEDTEESFLSYALELPQSAGPVQEAFGIREQHVLSLKVRNPEVASSVPELLGRTADLPVDLIEDFGGRRYMPVDTPALLDVEAVELAVVGTSLRAAEDLGIELDPEHESEGSAEFFLDLGLQRDEHPMEPLLKGEWR